MKNKYQRLSATEKKQARLDFRNSEYNKNKIYEKGNRLRIFDVIGMAYALISFAIDFYYKATIWNFILDAILLIFCVVTFISFGDIINKQINKYLIERDKLASNKKNRK